MILIWFFESFLYFK
jgi:hypothetical protein